MAGNAQLARDAFDTGNHTLIKISRISGMAFLDHHITGTGMGSNERSHAFDL